MDHFNRDVLFLRYDNGTIVFFSCLGNRGGSVGSAFDSGPVLSVRVPPAELNISPFPPVFHDCVIKGLAWYVQPRLCDWAYKRSRATYRKEKGIVSRWSVPPSFIHQVIIITGLNKLYNCMFSP